MFNLGFEATAAIGIFFIFFMTAFGAGFVFFVKKDLSQNFNRIFLGFAAGVMIAAAIWSLILPAMEDSKANGFPIPWLPAVGGFLLGCLFLLLVDNLLPHMHINENVPEGMQSKLKRTTMLVLAIALHNAPEGLAVGLAFGYAIQTQDPVLLASALGLAIGIGIQNFPEGVAVAIPLKQSNVSTKKAFMLGTLSGFVEPVFAFIGILLASQLTSIMPWFLAFAAGAMFYVVVEELIPEAQLGNHSHIGTFAFIIGFLLMIILDGAM